MADGSTPMVSMAADDPMQQVLALLYLWLKSGHVIFVIFWMAGLFMLPRFFVYHQEADAGSAEEGRWVAREQRLLRIILHPSLALVWVLGLLLAWQTAAFGQGWLHGKLGVVLALTGYHLWMAGYAASLARGERPLTGRKLRLLNEVPGIAAALIVVLVVVKPF